MAQDKWCNKHRKAGCKCGRHQYPGIEDAILRAMQRAYQEDNLVRCYPETLLPYMEESCSKRTVERHLPRLAQKGKLIRFNSRSGYELAPRERWCNKHKRFQCSCGNAGFRGIEDAIINAMRRAYDEDGRGLLLPHEVLIYIEDQFFCHHGTMRRYMAKLAQMGKLVRVGTRQGYKLSAI